jgi:hypothetical protein
MVKRMKRRAETDEIHAQEFTNKDIIRAIYIAKIILIIPKTQKFN